MEAAIWREALVGRYGYITTGMVTIVQRWTRVQDREAVAVMA